MQLEPRRLTKQKEAYTPGTDAIRRQQKKRWVLSSFGKGREQPEKQHAEFKAESGLATPIDLTWTRASLRLYYASHASVAKLHCHAIQTGVARLDTVGSKYQVLPRQRW
ncbi:hypothetical protein E2562_002131 [Oryza meyeriana var. granulata]|uniref:Uncharacterized protein n=1 Tax=Oryza meyeriana var. granulata TaxID=110450 RepID=A0A6G1EEP4_9ORYZ|nr:hypothetical protein E2562_002131 [Oryza meyeriana var. granulata]